MMENCFILYVFVLDISEIDNYLVVFFFFDSKEMNF